MALSDKREKPVWELYAEMRLKELNLQLADERKWIDAEGNVLDMGQMSTSHILNCKKLLERRDPPGADALLAAFDAELDRRRGSDGGFSRLAEVARSMLLDYERACGPLKPYKYRKMLEDMGIEVQR